MNIKKVGNGYIVTNEDGCSVYEDADGKAHCMMLQRMLYDILQELGEIGSKHDEFRVRINIEHKGKICD